MEKFEKSQILKLFLIVAFIIITPLLSSSLRPAYLFLVLNILIIAVGAESGLLSFISSTPEDHNKPLQSNNDKNAAKLRNETKTSSEDDQTKVKPEVQQKLPASEDDQTKQKSGVLQKSRASEDDQTEQTSGVLQKLSSEKFEAPVELINPTEKCDATTSLLVVGKEAEEFVEDDFQENDEEISEEELYDRAETFIQDFYKQLKMQREESWQKLDGVFYQQTILSQ